MEKGRILVNERMETNLPGIFAIGDVVGGVLLAHVASGEGIVAGENAMGNQSKIDTGLFPIVSILSLKLPALVSVRRKQKRWVTKWL